jgi:murein L,D-transpeptidase YcbB/YkuD
MRKHYILIASAILVSFLFSCKGRNKEVIVDTTITQQTGFNNLFLDSNTITKFIEANPEFENFSQQYLDFYKTRNYQYAWFDSSGLAEQAHNFVNLMHSGNENLDSLQHDDQFDLVYKKLVSDSSKFRGFDQQVQHAELLFTGEFFSYAAQKYGVSELDASELGWFIPRKKVDLTKMLGELLKNKVLADTNYSPLNSQFGKLQEQLPKYNEIEKNYPTDTLAYPAKLLKPGDKSALVKGIKQRLFALGDLTEIDSTNEYNYALEAAVKIYQDRTGLLVDGVIGRNFVQQLNIPISERIKQIVINIERARWMPAETDSIYLFVNIPEFMLHAYQNKEHAFDMPVIVGKEGSSTVIFNGKLRYVVFAPYWNVPENIVKNEILPKMKKDPYYLETQNMEITKKGAIPTIRQKPGPDNSLGQIKFLFPNNYNIYLHDTPNKELFNQTRRNFSHGCIRVSDPPKLAEFLLQNQEGYDYTKITELMNGFEEKWVTMKRSVPVFITYFTAWVDRNGNMNFRRDIYGHDQKMADKLFTK